jgi:uncharacterized membrane protein
MPKLRYEVNLSAEEKETLKEITRNGKSTAREIMHARILLATDDTREPKLTVRQVAEKCDSTTTTAQTVRRLYATQGLEAALERKKRETPPVDAKITGDVEAKLVALACTEPPQGRAHWALRLLADRAVELEIIDSISHSSVRTVLKKHNSNLI